MSESSEDELDKLTRSFAEQASQDLQKAAKNRQEQQSRHTKPKGMKEIRQEGLEAPVSEHSK